MLDKEIENLRNAIDFIVKDLSIDVEELNERMQEKMLLEN